MMKPKNWHCEIYKFHIEFCIKWKPKDFSAFMKKKYNYERSYESLGGACVTLSEPALVIWTNKSDKNNCYLMHECIHAANWILGERGFQFDYKNDEPQAYLAELIFRKALEK